MMTINIGNIEIELNHVTLIRTAAEDGGDFHAGTANITWRGYIGGQEHTHDLDVPVGCWDDTDDDCAEWAAWHEGASAIERCLGGTGSGDMRGTAVQMAFRGESEELGREICDVLRAAAHADEHVAYAS